jgi:hypothetical protein
LVLAGAAAELVVVLVVELGLGEGEVVGRTVAAPVEEEVFVADEDGDGTTLVPVPVAEAVAVDSFLGTQLPADCLLTFLVLTVLFKCAFLPSMTIAAWALE